MKRSTYIFFLILALSISTGRIVHKIFQFTYNAPGNCRNVPYNITVLERELSKNLFGQPLVNEIVNILEGYKKQFVNDQSKALTMSFQGTPGVGKSYVSKIIADALFVNGMNSPFVKMYIAKESFPSLHKVSEYQEKLSSDIKNMMKICDKALIIFDEVNDIPPRVLDVLKPMIDYHGNVDGIDYRKIIFIFISNVGGMDIAEELNRLDNDKYSLDFNNFENILKNAMRDALGDDEDYGLVYHDLIDHYIPFLPLTWEDVEKCVQVEFQKLHINHVSEDLINEVMITLEEMILPNESDQSYVLTGCKRIFNKVHTLAQKNKLLK